jgi:hypothetical protein
LGGVCPLTKKVRWLMTNLHNKMTRQRICIILVFSLLLVGCKRQSIPVPIETATLRPTTMPTSSPTTMPTPSPVTMTPASVPGVEVIGHIGGRLGNIFVIGNHAYVTFGLNFVVLDLSDPMHPVRVGNLYLPDVVTDIVVVDSFAYVVCEDDALRILDVSDPDTPIEVGSFTPVKDDYALCEQPASHFRDIVLVGNYVYIPDGDYGLRIVDVSNPREPVEVSVYSKPQSLIGVAVAGKNGYVLGDRGSLWVLDVSNPNEVVEKNEMQMDPWPWNIVVEDNYAYAVNFYNLQVLDLTNPISPTVAAIYDPPWGLQRVSVVEGLAYVSCWPHSQFILDVHNPTTPVEVGWLEAPRIVGSVAAVDGYVYGLGSGEGVRVLDMSDPVAPIEVGFYDEPGPAENMTIQGDYAYLAERGGVSIVDVSDPVHPAAIGFFDMGGIEGFASDVIVANEYVYVAHDPYGVRVGDISDPSRPVEIGLYWEEGPLRALAQKSHYVYAVYENRGLGVFDIADPPEGWLRDSTVSFLEIPGESNAIVFVDDYAYIVSGWDRDEGERAGLHVVNVSEPANPIHTSFYATLGDALDVAVSGDYAYVLEETVYNPIANRREQEARLLVLDISDVETIAEVGFLSIPEGADYIALANGLALLAGWEGLWLVDITDPTAPFEAAYYDMALGGEGLTVINEYVYALDRGDGLLILELAIP